jgi:hypothetical protein
MLCYPQLGEAKPEQSEEIRVLTHFNTSRAVASDHGMTVAKQRIPDRIGSCPDVRF